MSNTSNSTLQDLVIKHAEEYNNGQRLTKKVFEQLKKEHPTPLGPLAYDDYMKKVYNARK